MHTDPDKHTTVDQSVCACMCVRARAQVHTRGNKAVCTHWNKPYYKGCFKSASVEQLMREPVADFMCLFDSLGSLHLWWCHQSESPRWSETSLALQLSDPHKAGMNGDEDNDKDDGGYRGVIIVHGGLRTMWMRKTEMWEGVCVRRGIVSLNVSLDWSV